MYGPDVDHNCNGIFGTDAGVCVVPCQCARVDLWFPDVAVYIMEYLLLRVFRLRFVRAIRTKNCSALTPSNVAWSFLVIVQLPISSCVFASFLHD